MDDARREVGVRWTIADAGELGYESLRLSIHGAVRVFGPRARYVVCVHGVTVAAARARTGPVPEHVEWRAVGGDIDPRVRAYLDDGLLPRLGWSFAPMRLFPDRHELSLSHECVLWSAPRAIRAWLEDDASCVLASDVAPRFGRFAAACGPVPRSPRIRGLGPGVDLGMRVAEVLAREGDHVRSDLDEDGLQIAAMPADGTLVVSPDEVPVCSPFARHRTEPGTAGAIFAGVGARADRFSPAGRAAHAITAEHFARWRALLHEKVGLAPRADAA